MSDVEINVDEAPEVVPAPTVVVVPQSESDAVPAWAVALIERVSALEQSVTVTTSVVEEVANLATDAAIAADVALDASDTALSVAIDAAETADEVAEVAIATADETGVLPEVITEVTANDVIEDVTPRKTHPLFRSASEWRADLA